MPGWKSGRKNAGVNPYEPDPSGKCDHRKVGNCPLMMLLRPKREREIIKEALLWH